MATTDEILTSARTMISWRIEEKDRLAVIHQYLRGKQDHAGVPRGVPDDVRRLARLARVNVMKIVVNSVTQCLFVDGFRQKLQAEDAPAWQVWQANKMDREIGRAHV